MTFRARLGVEALNFSSLNRDEFLCEPRSIECSFTRLKFINFANMKFRRQTRSAVLATRYCPFHQYRLLHLEVRIDKTPHESYEGKLIA